MKYARRSSSTAFRCRITSSCLLQAKEALLSKAFNSLGLRNRPQINSTPRENSQKELESGSVEEMSVKKLWTCKRRWTKRQGHLLVKETIHHFSNKSYLFYTKAMQKMFTVENLRFFCRFFSDSFEKKRIFYTPILSVVNWQFSWLYRPFCF